MLLLLFYLLFMSVFYDIGAFSGALFLGNLIACFNLGHLAF